MKDINRMPFGWTKVRSRGYYLCIIGKLSEKVSRTAEEFGDLTFRMLEKEKGGINESSAEEVARQREPADKLAFE